jgi:hypothetical protein
MVTPEPGVSGSLVRRRRRAGGRRGMRSCARHRRSRSLQLRRSIMLISVDWVPPYWCPSRRLLRSRGEGRSLVTRPKIAPIPGLRLRRRLEIMINGSVLGAGRGAPQSGRQRHRAGNRPGECRHLAGDGHHDLVGVLAPSGELPIPLAQSYLGLPADPLDLRREFLQAQL